MKNQHLNSGFSKADTLKTKGIAILLLCFHHLFSTDKYIKAYDVHVPNWLTLEQLTRIGSIARVCVWIFVFLSAYGLAVKYFKKSSSTPRFLYNQWWSLMKSYWFFYLVFFLLSFVMFKPFPKVYDGNWLHIGLDFLALGDLFGTKMRYGLFWYMSFAQVLLLLMPIMIAFVKKVGFFSLPITFVLTQAFGAGFYSKYGGTYLNYIYTAQLAIVCAQYNFFARTSKKRGLVVSILEAIALLITFVVLADWKITLVGTDIKPFAYFVIGVAVVALCVFIQKYTTHPFAEAVLSFLGKHSGNMFLIHAVIYANFPEIVFATKRVLLSWLTLVVVSLIISIVFEWIKKVIRYNKGVSILSDGILRVCYGCAGSVNPDTSEQQVK